MKTTTSDHKINLELSYFGTKTKSQVNEINNNFHVSGYPTLENCLFGEVSLTKNADTDRYKCSG